MKNCLRIFLIFSLTLLAFCQTRAERQDNKGIYIFTIGTSLKDSTFYISSISKLESATLEKSTKFLSNRSFYSDQFKNYLNKTYGADHTCAVFFSGSKSALEKKYLKLRKQYNGKSTVRLVEISNSDFTFVESAEEGQ